jgi:hypothetical protein
MHKPLDSEVTVTVKCYYFSKNFAAIVGFTYLAVSLIVVGTSHMVVL